MGYESRLYFGYVSPMSNDNVPVFIDLYRFDLGKTNCRTLSPLQMCFIEPFNGMIASNQKTTDAYNDPLQKVDINMLIMCLRTSQITTWCKIADAIEALNSDNLVCIHYGY